MNREKSFRRHQFPRIPLPIVKEAKARGNNGQRFERLFGAATAQGEPLGESCLFEAGEIGTDPGVDLERIEAVAYTKGFSKGEQDGIAAAGHKLQKVLESLAEAAAGLTQLQQALDRNSEARLVELALAIGRKIVGYEIAANRQVVVHIAREVLKSVGNLQEVTVKMNPEDLRFLKDNPLLSSQLAPHISQVNLQADEGIESGGCIIDSSCGVIDARIESQLELIEKAFQTELDKADERDA